MYYTIKRSQKEIEDLVSRCAEMEATGENPFWGLTYHEGILAAIEWLNQDNPMSDDHPLAE